MVITKPKVTIAIPTRNRAEFLSGAIESALNQSHTNVEVIVSDNASTDGTPGIIDSIKDDRLVVLKQKTNIGLGGNFNACLAKATGEFFLLLPDDDLLDPNAIEDLLKPFVSGKLDKYINVENIGMVYGQTKTIDEDGRITGYSKHAPQIENALDFITMMFEGKREPYLCSILVRTKDLSEHGGFDEARFTLALDAAAWLKIILARGDVVFVPEVISGYRRHSIAITANARISQWVLADSSLVNLCEKFYRDRNNSKSAQKIRKFGQKFISRKVACLIALNVRNGGLRRKAFQQCFIYYRNFLSLYGFYIISINIFKIVLPNRLFYVIKKFVSPSPY